MYPYTLSSPPIQLIFISCPAPSSFSLSLSLSIILCILVRSETIVREDPDEAAGDGGREGLHNRVRGRRLAP